MSRDVIHKMLYSMSEGQECVFNRHEIDEAFPVHPLFGIYRTSREALLSSLMGTAWGSFTCEQNIWDGSYKISRNATGEKRVYCDPDREHLYKRMPDGTLEYIGGQSP